MFPGKTNMADSGHWTFTVVGMLNNITFHKAKCCAEVTFWRCLCIVCSVIGLKRCATNSRRYCTYISKVTGVTVS